MVGFYSLVVGSADPQTAPSRVMKGLARHPVPVMILARLAVDKEYQRKSLGKALLKDDVARRWYESWEFEPSQTDPYHLFLMLKDLKNLLA